MSIILLQYCYKFTEIGNQFSALLPTPIVIWLFWMALLFACSEDTCFCPVVRDLPYDLFFRYPLFFHCFTMMRHPNCNYFLISSEEACSSCSMLYPFFQNITWKGLLTPIFWITVSTTTTGITTVLESFNTECIKIDSLRNYIQLLIIYYAINRSRIILTSALYRLK